MFQRDDPHLRGHDATFLIAGIQSENLKRAIDARAGQGGDASASWSLTVVHHNIVARVD